MEERKAKILFCKTGNNSTTTKITLPVPWVRAIGSTPEDREVTIKLEDNKITITKED
jgi:hypothetical protein